MTSTGRTPPPSSHRGGGVYSARVLTDAELRLASALLVGFGMKTLIVF